MTRVSDEEFTLPLILSTSPPPFEGMIVRASGDPLHGPGALVAYESEGETRYGYIQTRLATDVRGRRWGMGLLYDVDASADADLPAPGAPLGARARQRAEIEFSYA